MMRIIPGLFGPPTCLYCHQKLKKREELGGLMNCIETVIRRICNPTAPTQYGCTGKVPNKKFELWEEECKKIDEKNKKIRRQNMLLKFTDRQKPEIPYPPKPPKKVVCPNHYSKLSMGKYNEKTVSKRHIYFDNIGNIYYH